MTGQRPFKGQSTGDILAAVVKDEPDWSLLPAGSPVALLKRCLTKDRKQRLQAIGEFRIALEQGSAEVQPQAEARATGSKLAWTVSAALGAVATVALWGWLKPQPPASAPVTRFAISFDSKGKGLMPTFSPDGSRIAWRASGGIFIRNLAEFETKALGACRR